MKKHIFTFIAMLATTVALAQFTYGPKIGFNASRFANDKFMPGIQAGAFLNSEIYDRMGIQIDFLYAIKGNKHEVGPDTLLTTTTTYYRFVEIPICAYFPVSKHIRGFFGPQLNIYRKGNQTVEYRGKSTETKVSGTGVRSWIVGFDFNFDSPLTLGLRFVSNKFTSTNFAGDSQDNALNSVLVSIGYTMDW
ncbi:MAG: outer membrane beta-barrel protein [bacterium]|nr:outer membrane beta-barrel protein [bacterium]